MTTLTTDEAIDDFLRGASFMSASGGGDPAHQRRLLQDDLRRGLHLGWEPLEASSQELACTACFSGSIAPDASNNKSDTDPFAPGARLERPMVEAIRELQGYIGQPITGLVSIEIGGINTGAVLDAAANLGITLIDGDYAGRAIPELHATTPHVFGIDLFPWGLCDEFGNRLLVRTAASDAFGERISKFLALASFGWIACALVPVPASTVGRIYIP